MSSDGLWRASRGTVVLSVAGWVAMGAAPVNAIVAPWFVRTRPAAIAMAYDRASIGGVVLSPLWVALIAAFGFTLGAAFVGMAMLLIIGALSMLVFSQTPERLGQSPDGDAPGQPAANVTSPFAKPLPGGAMWRDRSFHTLAAGMALSLFAQIGLIAHLYSLLVPPLGPQGAGLAMGLATACAILYEIISYPMAVLSGYSASPLRRVSPAAVGSGSSRRRVEPSRLTHLDRPRHVRANVCFHQLRKFLRTRAQLSPAPIPG